MKATYDWIKDYVPDFAGSIEEMCERFTMSGTEVEFWSEAGADKAIEFSVTSNRVDCLGIAGLGRELAAAAGVAFRAPDATVEEGSDPVEDVVSVSIEDGDGCSRFTAQVIEGVKVGPSPDWLVARLEAIGLRSVNNVVDVTNYVMFETNQPFHAFDLDGINDGALIVRRGKAGEKIVAINDKEYEVTPEMILVCDPTGPKGIAGVMGGAESEVSEKTTRVLLEAACFDRLRTRATSRKLNLASDSSFRFERGVDGQRTDEAARRCARMMVEVCGGTLRRGMIDVGFDPLRWKTPNLAFRHEEVERITGIEIPWERCREIFEALEMRVDGDPRSGIVVTPPSWRPDVTREIDLIEEVIRIHGLHNLPLETSMTVMPVATTREARVRRLVLEAFVACGFSETLTTSFLAAADASACLFADTEPVTIGNPMRADESALRQSLLPSLLRVRKINQDRSNDDIRIMEATVVYLQRPEGGIPEHLPIVGALMDTDYRTARGVIERVVASAGIRGVSFEALDVQGRRLLEESGGATIMLGDEVVGHVGRPTDEVRSRHELRQSPYYAELRLDRIVAAAALDPTYTPVSRFPSVKRDLAMVVDDAVQWGRVREIIEALGLSDLESLDFFDEYRGKQVPAGKKSLAFSLTYRSPDRTLTGDEVDASQQRAIEALETGLNAQIRAS